MTGCKLQEKYYLVLKWSSLIFHLKSRNWNLCFISINDGMLFVTSWTKEYLLMKIFTEDSWERSWDKYYKTFLPSLMALNLGTYMTVTPKSQFWAVLFGLLRPLSFWHILIHLHALKVSQISHYLKLCITLDSKPLTTAKKRFIELTVSCSESMLDCEVLFVSMDMTMLLYIRAVEFQTKIL